MKSKNYYDHQIQRWMKEGKCGADKASQINTIIDQRAMEHIRTQHKELYWDIMREIHEVCEGCHFNEMFAMWQVAQMHHTSKEGKVYQGEHWTVAQVQSVLNAKKSMLGANDNVYDLYVALNSYYHDYCTLYKQWFAEDEFETKIIEGAINFFFNDEDYPSNGKVWRYFRCLNYKPDTTMYEEV